MKESSRGNWMIAAAAAIILGTLGLYMALLYNWLSDTPAVLSAPPSAAPRDPQALLAARQSFRQDFVDARAWLRLSEALSQAGQPIDGFYVMQGAREFFGEQAFFKAHAQVILKQEQDYLGGQDYDPSPGNEERLKARLQSDPDNPGLLVYLARISAQRGEPQDAHRRLDFGLTAHPQNPALLFAKAQLSAPSDPLAAISFFARLINAAPDSYEGQRALEALGLLAQSKEDGPRAEASRLAREALEELKKAHPKHPAIFATLALALWSRDDVSTIRALVDETARKNPGHPGVSMMEGALALYDHETDKAVKRFTDAWERNPDDLFSAAKLAQIYDKQRGDPESALPYHIALYRRDPRREESEPLEQTIRRTLDQRRQQVLKNIGAEGLGRFLKSEDASLRAEACVKAAELQDPRWLEVLAELLDDDTEIVRHNADYALYQLAKAYPDAVQVRRDEWLANAKPLLRARALNLFADLYPQETMPLVLRALYDPNAAVRFFAKAMVLDRYYKGVPAASRAGADYMAQEKNPLVLALFDGRKAAAAAKP